MTRSSLRIRGELLRIVHEYPGLHLRELARQATISQPLAVYHLNRLERQGLVASTQDTNYRRFFALDGKVPSAEETATLILLRHRLPLEAVTHLLDHGPIGSADLARSLGYGRTTIIYHLNKLEAAGLLFRRGSLYALRDPERLERLLVKWRPPEGLLDRFSGLWNVLYRKRRRDGG